MLSSSQEWESLTNILNLHFTLTQVLLSKQGLVSGCAGYNYISITTVNNLILQPRKTKENDSDCGKILSWKDKQHFMTIQECHCWYLQPALTWLSADSICPQTKYEIRLWPFLHCDPVWTTSSRFSWCITAHSLPFLLSIFHTDTWCHCVCLKTSVKDRVAGAPTLEKNSRAAMDAACIRGRQTKCLDSHRTSAQGHPSIVKPRFFLLSFFIPRRKRDSQKMRKVIERDSKIKFMTQWQDNYLHASLCVCAHLKRGHHGSSRLWHYNLGQLCLVSGATYYWARDCNFAGSITLKWGINLAEVEANDTSLPVRQW